MNDELHFYKDINISRARTGARILYTVTSFTRTISENRFLFSACLSGTLLFLSAVSDTAGLYARQPGCPALFFILVFQTAVLFLFFASAAIGRKISFRFNSSLSTGMRDSWFFLSLFNMYAIFFMPLPGPGKPGKMLMASCCFIALLAAAVAVYIKKIAPKKLPELDIPLILEADKPVDARACGSHDKKKIQINGDTRNAFLCVIGEPLRLTLAPGTCKYKIAVGMREKRIAGPAKEVLVEIHFIKRGDSREKIFSRVMAPLKDKNDRSWLEAGIEFGEEWADREKDIVIETHPLAEGSRETRGDKKIFCVAEPRKSPPARPRKIILIILDGVRADHIGNYGYARNTTPNIDRLAGEGVRFTAAMVQGEWTLPSFMSMLTGMYPSAHNVYHHSSYHVLNRGISTLPEILRAGGFITRCFFTHKRLMSFPGFARGFDSHYFEQCDKDTGRATADQVTDKALDLLEFHKDDDLFLMLHYFDTHQPCDPVPPFSVLFDKKYDREITKNVRRSLMKRGGGFDRKDIDNLAARYDAEIYRADLKVGVIMDYLKQTGRYDDSTIVVTSDHGMLLNDHGSMTRISLFDETVRVPFIIKFPRHFEAYKDVRAVDDIIEANIDIMPTLLDIAGLKIPDNVQGKSRAVPGPGGKDYAVSESLYGKDYMVSLRDATHRFTFRSVFDIRSFSNFREDEASEALYKVSGDGPEKPKDLSDCGDLRNKYRKKINAHIQKNLEINRNISKKGDTRD